MGQYTVGIIGCGRAGADLHLPSFRDLGCDVVAVCDCDVSRAHLIASNNDIPRAVGSADDLLAMEPDIIAICTPPDTHAELVEKAVGRCRALLVEKPFATTTLLAQRMLDACARRSTAIAALHNYLTAPSMCAAVNAYRRGEIGTCIAVSKIWTTTVAERMLASVGHWAQALPGGRWTEAMPHHLYPVMRLAGALRLCGVSVTETVRTPALMASHILVALQCGQCPYTIMLGLSDAQRYGVLAIYGSLGQIQITHSHAWMRRWASEDWVPVASTADDTSAHIVSGHGAFIRQYVGFLEGRCPSPLAVDEIVDTVRITEEIGNGIVTAVAAH